MQFYLSSYKFGNRTSELSEFAKTKGNKIAFISNALDFSSDIERRKKGDEAEMNQLKELGFVVEQLDLREYFGKEKDLEKIAAGYNAFWVRGGNIFVLRQAMKLSGFDSIVKKLALKDSILYAGYSAGVGVLSPTLKGYELMDDPNIMPYGAENDTIWEGLGLIDYLIVPHYRSDHPESLAAEKAAEYFSSKKIKFKPLRDGEVIIIN